MGGERRNRGGSKESVGNKKEGLGASPSGSDVQIDKGNFEKLCRQAQTYETESAIIGKAKLLEALPATAARHHAQARSILVSKSFPAEHSSILLPAEVNSLQLAPAIMSQKQ